MAHPSARPSDPPASTPESGSRAMICPRPKTARSSPRTSRALWPSLRSSATTSSPIPTRAGGRLRVNVGRVDCSVHAGGLGARGNGNSGKQPLPGAGRTVLHEHFAALICL